MIKGDESPDEINLLIDSTLRVADQGSLNHIQIQDLMGVIRFAITRGADAEWIKGVHDRVADLLQVHENSRRAAARAVDPYGRRNAIRITMPPLLVAFDDGMTCQTIDWSVYGILVAGVPETLLADTAVQVHVTADGIDYGGYVSGHVLRRRPSDNAVIDFGRPQVVMQRIKIYLLRAGLLESGRR